MLLLADIEAKICHGKLTALKNMPFSVEFILEKDWAYSEYKY